MNEAEIQRIVRQIAGPVPRLWLPAPATAAPPSKMVPFVVAPSLHDLPAGSASQGEVWALLEGLPMPEALTALSGIGLIVARVGHRDPLHAKLIKTFLASDRLAEVVKVFAKEEAAAIQVFNRRNVLMILRLLLALSAIAKGDHTTPPTNLGELALVANDYLSGKALKDAIRSEQVDYVPFMVDAMASWDVVNPPDLAYGLARVYRMLRTHLAGANPTIRALRERFPIDLDTVQFGGIVVEDYIACVFGLYSWLNGRSADDLVSGADNCVIDIDGLLGVTKFSKATLDAFIAATSRTVAEFRDEVSAGTIANSKDLRVRMDTDHFLTETLPFRERPLCRLDESHVICLDLPFLSDLVVSGLYWQYVKVLNAVDRSHGSQFAELWGHLLELHVADLLSTAYPTSFSPLRTNVEYDGGQVDAILEFGDAVLLFEVKSSLLKSSAKYNRDRREFESDFQLKFVENERGSPKALKQLANASEAAVSGKLGLAAKPKNIYPVFVGYDSCLDSFCVNQYANELFGKLLGNSLREIVRPLTVMSVEALEIVLPYTSNGDISWTDLLDLRFRPGHSVTESSVSQTLFDWRTESRVPQRRNQQLIDEFTAIYNGILDRYRGGPQ